MTSQVLQRSVTVVKSRKVTQGGPLPAIRPVWAGRLWATRASKLKLGPENMHSFGPFETPPVAVPGKTELV